MEGKTMLINTKHKLAHVLFSVVSFFIIFVSAHADSSQKLFSDTDSGFSMMVPANWAKQNMSNNESNTHLFMSPDQNVSVAVTTYNYEMSNLEQLLTKFQQSVFSGSNRLLNQTSALNGINGMLQAYRVFNGNAQIIVGAFGTAGNGKSYVVWSMIPENIYNSRFPESDAILNTFTMIKAPADEPVAVLKKPLSNQNSTPPSPPEKNEDDGAGSYLPLVLDDSMVEFDIPAHFAPFEKETGQSQWADPKSTMGNRVVMVIQTLGRNFGNTAQSVFDNFVNQVNSSATAAMVSSSKTTVNNVPGYKLYFTVQTSSGKSHLKYLILDLSGPNVVAVSYVGPDSTLAEIGTHYQQLLKTAKESKPAAAGFPEPQTPEDTFFAIQQTIKNGDWNSFVNLLHSKTVKTEMSRYFGQLARDNNVNINGLSPSEAMLRVFQQVPEAPQSKIFLSKPAKIKSTRKEDENRVLVIVEFDGGKEHYLWMFRENGNWRWYYN